MRTKWFIINEKEKTFKSKRIAKTKKEAWDKTLLKWVLRADDYDYHDDENSVSSCGHCNYIMPNGFGCIGKSDCILSLNNYGNKESSDCCVPFINDPDLQYLWLLFVREASK